MESFLDEKEEKKGINKGFIIGIVVGVIAIAAGIWLLSFRPSVDDQKTDLVVFNFLGSTVANGAGQFIFLDNASALTRRFYRARLPAL